MVVLGERLVDGSRYGRSEYHQLATGRHFVWAGRYRRRVRFLAVYRDRPRRTSGGERSGSRLDSSR